MTALVRGDNQAARSRFGQLRDELIQQRDQFTAGNREHELRILEYVEYRLRQFKE